MTLERYFRRIFIVTLAVVVALVGLWGSGAHATSITIEAAEDVHIDKSHPQKIYGGQPILAAGQDPQELSFLKFQVSGLLGPTTLATLRLHVVDGSRQGPKLARAGNKWREDRVTWDRDPAYNKTNSIGEAGSVASGTWVEFDVTKVVSQNGTYAFVLIGTSDDRTVFSSREGDHPPQLVLGMVTVESEPPTVPTEPTPPLKPKLPPSTPDPATPPASGGWRVRAVPADAFVDSIGINAHLGWKDTIWDTAFATYKPLLGELGVRYVRTTANHTSRPKLLALYQDYGIRANFLVDLRTNGVLDGTKVKPNLDFIRDQIGVDKVIAVEGANEYNSDREVNTIWADQLRGYQKTLHEAVRSDPAFRDEKVIGPSIWRRIYDDFVAVGNLGNYSDIANLHYYTGGRKPTLWAEGGSEYPLDTALWAAKILVPDTPAVWVTETGYNNIADTVDSPFAVPERSAAKYTLRLLLEIFRRGNQAGKIFIYSLLDDPNKPEHEFGLLRTDFSRKAAYFAVKNAIRLLADPGPAFTSGTLVYSLDGDLTSINHIVMQKRNGRFYLLIWQDGESFDRKAASEATVPPRRLTLDVGTHRFSGMNVYLPTAVGLADPNAGVTPVRTVASPTWVTIDVPDHVMMIEMIP